jgi:hypothetical protein
MSFREADRRRIRVFKRGFKGNGGSFAEQIVGRSEALDGIEPGRSAFFQQPANEAVKHWRQP